MMILKRHKMENKHNIIFLGAGVANLVAANRLLDYSIDDFIILEKGEKLDNRNCISEGLHTCKKCQKGCATLEGVGGANALHGNKLCYFPASSQITDSYSTHEINNVLSYLNNLASPFFDVNFNSCQKDNNSRKKYNSDVLDKKHFNQMINKLTARIDDKIIANCNIVKFKASGNGFNLLTSSNNEYYCNKLIIGTGRSSYKFLRNQLTDLGIKFKSLTQDIGIRIETNKDNFSNQYYYQVDPKFKFNWHGLGQGRTFCAHNQGVVVPVKFGESFFADGAFTDKFGSYNNIALMVRGEVPLSIDKLENWCQKINESSNDNLILGSVDLKQNDGEIISQILGLIPIFPTNVHKELLTRLLKELVSGKNNIFRDSYTSNSELKIYGPAIDRQWIAPLLNDDFSTKQLDNLFIIGDAAGRSRGFVQAMFSGAIWADRLFTNSNLKSKIEWLNLV